MIITRGNTPLIFCNMCNKRLIDTSGIIHDVVNKKLKHFCNIECKELHDSRYKSTKMAAPTLMKVFFDTEFIEGPQTKTFLGIPIGKTKPTIE